MAAALLPALQSAFGGQASSVASGIQGLVTTTMEQTFEKSEPIKQVFAAKDQLAQISNPSFGAALVGTLEGRVRQYVDQEITKKLAGQGGGALLGPDRVPPSVASGDPPRTEGKGQAGGGCFCPRCPHCRRQQKKRARGRTMSRRGTRRANRKSRRASRKNRRSTRRGRR
jgi:hypothetical protein